MFHLFLERDRSLVPECSPECSQSGSRKCEIHCKWPNFESWQSRLSLSNASTCHRAYLLVNKRRSDSNKQARLIKGRFALHYWPAEPTVRVSTVLCQDIVEVATMADLTDRWWPKRTVSLLIFCRLQNKLNFCRVLQHRFCQENVRQVVKAMRLMVNQASNCAFFGCMQVSIFKARCLNNLKQTLLKKLCL